ncbi:aspartate ammonia-lyase [Paraburkholderia phymatum]|uniref:Aspartate ammonia-lyase n=1 Tax=Paraburkholderia phymatum TaxID=148447 RepID=A0ACC6U927_9BURK
MSNSSSTEALTRTESDYWGDVSIPRQKLYGVNSVRGVENLSVSRRTIADVPEFVKAFALCKWAAALANRDLGVLTDDQCRAIVGACREIADGQHAASLVVDLLEGSGGTSTNMNFNEVIANRAQQLLGGLPGHYDLVHPNNHVNRSQSTNDVYPAAMKMAVYDLLAPLIDELSVLTQAFEAKSGEFGDVLHLGRTCLQDAQPMRLGQVFGGYAALANRLADELRAVRAKLLVLPLGGTAIGTGFGSPAGYRRAVFAHLVELSGIAYSAPDDSFDAMQNLDVFSRVSAELRVCGTSLGKIAADLILLSSGPVGGLGEITLPAVQAGSSIMPGKVNPVVPMSIVQLGMAVVGNDTCVAQAVQYGQLEINHFEPVVADRIFESVGLLTNGVRLFREKCVQGIRANVEVNERHLFESMAVATALVPTLGYAKVSELARKSVHQGQPLLKILEETGVLSATEARRHIEESTHPAF